MKYAEFLGQVQARARLGNEEAAVRATRATLQTLAERIFGKEAEHLAAQLPSEIGRFLTENPHKEKLSLDDFFHKVHEREGQGVDFPEAIYHARVVLEVLREAVSPGEIDHVLDQLPEEFDQLVEAGSQGDLDLPRRSKR
ncbi:MAG: DUF2267 domain-containing protein [Candidatus Zixiibacteriota bacterium]|nr:MAG: DUF2267 domain-containing protein [candidate division Zixibacteria bacterium]